MVRKLKTIGLTLIAALVMSAIMASVAQATTGNAQFTVEAGTTAIHADAEGIWAFTRGTRTVHCEVTKFSGPVTNGATEVIVTPAYEGCTIPGIGPATITFNGCGFDFTLSGEKPGPAHTWTATTDVVCPPGKQIEIHVYTSASNHANKMSVCTYDIGSTGNQKLNSTDLTEKPADGKTPKNYLTTDFTIEKITSTNTVGSVLLCGPEHDSNGSWHGNAVIKGTNAAGGITGITISTKLAG